jgi:hypothetical protein
MVVTSSGLKVNTTASPGWQDISVLASCMS